jgi:hypothetical protein
MYSLTLNITDNATRRLNQLLEDARPKNINPVVGRVARNTVRAHLYGLANKRHRPNVGQNFYEDAADATQYRQTDSGVEVYIPKTGIAQRYYGGTITPVNSQYLTIPAIPAAYGKIAREFDNLSVMWRNHIPIALVENASQGVSFTRRRKKGTYKYQTKRGEETTPGKIFFWLVKSVTQSSDPTVLPTETELLETIQQALEQYLNAK